MLVSDDRLIERVIGGVIFCYFLANKARFFYILRSPHCEQTQDISPMGRMVGC
jgi:hypothetical protein